MKCEGGKLDKGKLQDLNLKNNTNVHNALSEQTRFHNRTFYRYYRMMHFLFPLREEEGTSLLPGVALLLPRLTRTKALAAWSNTFLRPFCVNAEHSLYQKALISLASCWPCSKLVGVSFFFSSSFSVFGSSRISNLVPTSK